MARGKRLPTPLSHTAVALAPVLAAGPYEDRQTFNPAEAFQRQETDLEIAEVGREAKMPWEVDGRGWHTRDRVDRKGKAVRWDGQILDRVVDRIQELGQFSETNWNARSVVEIAAETKSSGWFFHAITAETWLLKMKFRITRGTFKRQNLVERLGLKTLNQMDEIPQYSNEPRVKCRGMRGPWQEVEVRAFSLEEVDTPEFWSFLEEAVASFMKFANREEKSPEDYMPWKKLGQKWHFLRKGFPPGRSVKWDAEVLEELFDVLSEIAPNGQFLWNNQQLVHLFVDGQKQAWASLQTKRPESLKLFLRGPKGATALGRISGLGYRRDLDGSRENHDIVQLEFRTTEHLHKGDLLEFLQEHMASVTELAK